MKRSGYSKQPAALCDIREHSCFGPLNGVVSLISFLMEKVGLQLVIGDMLTTVDSVSVNWILTRNQIHHRRT